MKHNVWKLIMIFMMIGLTAAMGCKKGEKKFDITDGSWGITLKTSSATSGWVYKFVGSQESGSIYYDNINLGTYTVNGDTVNFTTNHGDEENNVYVYVYNGVVNDYYSMNGTFVIKPPSGGIVTGTWTAVR